MNAIAFIKKSKEKFDEEALAVGTRRSRVSSARTRPIRDRFRSGNRPSMSGATADVAPATTLPLEDDGCESESVMSGLITTRRSHGKVGKSLHKCEHPHVDQMPYVSHSSPSDSSNAIADIWHHNGNSTSIDDIHQTSS